MAAKKEAVKFNEIINAERAKKKKQQLADQIFSSGRRSSTPATGASTGRKPPSGPASLASRVGVTKASANPKFNQANKPNAANRAQGGRGGSLQRSVSTPQLNKRNQMLNNLVNSGASTPKNFHDQVNVTQRAINGAGISVRGMSEAASLYTVIAQNFAPGTTAADIESVLASDKEQSGLVRCRLVASNPTVIAELVFTKKDAAEDVITIYNNKKADGRLLHVWMKDPPPESRRGPQIPPAPTSAPNPIVEDDLMDMDDSRTGYSDRRPAQQTYTPPRGMRAEPDVQDGRYGFSDNSYGGESYQNDRQFDQHDRRGRGRGRGRDGPGGLVSDGMIRRNDRNDNRFNGRGFRR